jgi:hypothetical protein
MANKVHLEVHLTLAEAKAIARLVKIGLAAMEKDEGPVNNPVTLQRAVQTSKSGLEKIETLIVNADPQYARQSEAEDAV